MSIYDAKINTLEGEPADLSEYKGKALLVVNVASKCGLTPQYTGLEQLHEQYGDRGFEVLGFPCNQFMGQEPGTPDEIREFCDTTYGVQFPLFEKIDVNGANRHPVYEELTQKADADGRGRGREVELREVPRLARRRRRGPLPPAGRARGPGDGRGDRGSAAQLVLRDAAVGLSLGLSSPPRRLTVKGSQASTAT